MHSIESKQDIVVVEPDIDIISLKMLSVLGYETAPCALKVRRRLFGCCDDSTRSSVSESLAQMESQDVQRSTQEWNFDFTTESPLPAGRYAWEKVRNCDVPEWYTSDDDHSQVKSRSVFHLLKSNRSSQIDQLSNRTEIEKCNLLSKTDLMNKAELQYSKKRLVQTSIKGYTKIQKKRTAKRIISKYNGAEFLKGSKRVANYILRNEGESTIS